MAEAAVECPTNSASPKYYCHQCSTSVELSPDLPGLTCPKCESGFIEEMTQDLQAEHSHQRSSQMQLRGNEMSSLISGLLFNNPDEDTDDEDDDDDDDDDDEIYHRTFRNDRRGHRRSRGPRRVPMFSSAESQTLPRFIEHLLRGLSGASSGRADGSLPFLASVFHGDPRDYAWGVDGLDNAITQLLNQWENSGSPPASKESIDGLESVKITQEHLDKEGHCIVCIEDFCLEDTVRCMPCQHVFHSACITTWLQLHNTCPICRLSLGGVDDEAETKPPDSSMSSGNGDNEDIEVDQSVSSVNVAASSESGIFGEAVREEPMFFDIDRTNSADVYHGSGNVGNLLSAIRDNTEITRSNQLALPLEVIDFDSSSEDYDSDF